MTGNKYSNNLWLQLLGVAVITAIVMAAYWLVRQPDFLFAANVDYTRLNRDYTLMVQDLLAGEGLRTFRYPPVFPLVLAASLRLGDMFGASPAVGVLLLLLSTNVLNTLLVFLCARRLWSLPAGLAAPALWLLHPAVWRQFEQPLSGTLFTTFLLAAVLLLIQALADKRHFAGRAALIGVLLGLAMLTRPIGIALGVITAGFIALFPENASFSSRLAGSGALLLASVLVVIPWELHAYHQLGDVIPLSTGGTPSILDGLSYAVDPSENRALHVPPDVRQLQEDIFERQYEELSTTGDIVRFFLAELRTRPGTVFKLFAIKAARSWYGTDSGTLDQYLLVLQLPFLMIGAVGVTVALRHEGTIKRIGLLTLILILYFWGMTTLVLSILRYMLPALALLFILAPGSVAVLIRPVARARLVIKE